MKGIYSALLGVADAQGRTNAQGLAALVRHNIDHVGVDGLYVNGSTGEAFLMTAQERVKVLEVAAQEAGGRVKMIKVREETLCQIKAAEQNGYDAISAVTPFYYKLSAAEIHAYYRDMATHSTLPLIAYYIPSMSGVTLSAEALSETLRIPGVIGIKYTSNDFFLMERLRRALPEKLVYSGFDEMLLSASVLKTDGAIGSTYNIIGHWAKRLYAAAQAGDLETARTWQGHMNNVIERLIQAGLYQTIKEVAGLYGVPVSGCRAPMAQTNQGHIAAAKAIYAYMEQQG